MRLLQYGALFFAVGCATIPREPYVWRDDKYPVGVHRADVARAEGRVIEYLVASGTLDKPGYGCQESTRAYEVATIETETAFQVRVIARPGLCKQAPEDTNLPSLPWGIYEGHLEFAVSKKDFHIIRERWGDEYSIEMPSAPSEPPPKWLVENTEPPPEATVPSMVAFAESVFRGNDLFRSSPRIPVGTCVGPVPLETRAEAGPRAVTAPVTVNLSVSPASAEFFSDATCTTAVTSVEVRAGAGDARFYFRPTQVGQLRISVAAEGMRGDSQGYDVEAEEPVALDFITPPQTVAEDTCSKPFAVQLQDAFGNRARVKAETSLQLLATPPGSVTFYAEPGCTGAAITATSIPANGDSAIFFLKGRVPRTVTVSAMLGRISVSQEEVVTPAQGASGHSR